MRAKTVVILYILYISDIARIISEHFNTPRCTRMEEMYTLYFVRVYFVCVVRLCVMRDLGILELAVSLSRYQIMHFQIKT